MNNLFEGGQRDPTYPCKPAGKSYHLFSLLLLFQHHYHPSHTLVNILSDILSFLDTFQITGEQGGERHPCSVLALQPKVIYPSSRCDDCGDDDCNDDDDLYST